MRNAASPVTESAFFTRAETVMDIIYNPWETEFLRLARAAGRKGVNGFAMLVFQAFKSYEIWQNIILTTKERQTTFDALWRYYGIGR
jgi:shikimate dehydrogenase